MSEPLEEDSYGEPESRGEAMEMDPLTSLMFEDTEEDGITGEEEHTSEEEEEKIEDLEGEEERPQARERVTPGGEDEVDGISALTLHNMIRNKRLKPTIKDDVVLASYIQNPCKQISDHNSHHYLTGKEMRGYGKELKRILQNSIADVDKVDPESGLAPIHHIVLERREHKTSLLLTLLVYGKANIDAVARDGKTTLMLAIMAQNIPVIKLLIALGANVNKADENGITPLQMALEVSGKLEDSDVTDSRGFETGVTLGHPNDVVSMNGTYNEEDELKTMHKLLIAVGAESHVGGPELTTTQSDMNGASDHTPEEFRQPDHNQIAQDYKILQEEVEARRAEYQHGPTPQLAEGVVKAMQQMEDFRVAKGSKILCLDGGGVRGLVQIAILRQIERRTGKRITQLFDWIVGTSTGGIIALALVYGKMSVTELQRLYLRLKRDVFSRTGVIQKGNSQQLEKYLQQLLCGTMDSVTHPKVLISTVSVGGPSVQLRFFNNCFEDDYSKEEVWKVARYTSASPTHFPTIDGYLDGSILSDNPSEDALTRIQQFYHKRNMKLPISLVVSLGSGINPPKPVGNATSGDVWTLLKRLKELLVNQTAESNCCSRCVEQGIEYVRLNPELKKEIDAGEKDNDLLLDMLWTTQQYLHDNKAEEDSSRRKMERLIHILRST